MRTLIKMWKLYKSFHWPRRSVTFGERPPCKLLNVPCARWARDRCRAASTSFTLILWPFQWISMCRERKYGCVSFAKDEWTRGILPGCGTPDVNQCRTRLYLFPVIYNWAFWVSGLTLFLERELRGEVSFHEQRHASYCAKTLMHSATAKSLLESICVFWQNLPSFHNVWMFFIVLLPKFCFYFLVMPKWRLSLTSSSSCSSRKRTKVNWTQFLQELALVG